MAQHNISPLNIPQKLAKTPTGSPKYPTMILNTEGEEVILADPTCTRALVALMNQHAVIGGAAAHWGGPAALAEIMSSIHGLMFQDKSSQWYDQYNFVNDAGHTENGVYAVRANLGFDNLTFKDLRLFRSIESKLTGHGEAHLNPEGVFLSNGPLGSGLPQAQGLAIADKLIGNNRTTICVISDGASMEGEAKEAFSAIPGFASKGNLNPFVMVVSDNNTKLSGRIDEDAFSMTPSFEALENLGWQVISVDNGHNLTEVYTAIEEGINLASEDHSKPICIHCKTIKGFSVKSTEESASGGHGYPLKPYDQNLMSFIDEIFTQNIPDEFKSWVEEIMASKPDSKKSEPAVKNEKVQVGVAKGLIRAAKEGLPVFSISADLQGSTGLANFHKEFPNNYFDVGVAESNMVSAAVGLSKQGFIPIVDTFAQFGVTKGNLPITMASLSLAPIIGIFSHTGFQDAADGASHQATTYISAVSSIPSTNVISLSCSFEAEELVYQACKRFKEDREAGKDGENFLFFLGRENFPQYYDKDLKYGWGKAQVLTEGNDVTIVATGPTVPKALLAKELLSKDGINATVINNVFINQIDIETITKALNNTGGHLITVEDHQIIGGMGAQLIHSLVQKGVAIKAQSLGISNKFGQSAYLADHLYAQHGFDEIGITAAAKALLNR